MSNPPKLELLAEAAILFVVLPLAYRFCPVELPPMPLLWSVALYCYAPCAKTPPSRTPASGTSRPSPADLPAIAALFVLQGSLLLLGVLLFARPALFSLPRTNPLA